MIAELAEDIVTMAKRGGGNSRNEEGEEKIGRKFHSMVIEGKMREVIHIF